MDLNRKDVVIQFKGRVDPSLRAAARQTEREAATLRQRLGRHANTVQGFGQGLGGKLSTGISAGLAGGFAGAGAYGVAALGVGLLKATGASEQLAKAFGYVTEKARETANAMKAVSDNFRAQTNKLIQAEVGPAQEATAKLYGRFSLPKGFPMSLFGERSGQFGEELSKIGESRRKIARDRYDPSVVGQLRAKYTQQMLQDRGITVGDRIQGVSETFLSMVGLGDVGRRAGTSRDRDVLRELRSRAGARATRDVRGRDLSLQRADDELAKRQSQIQGLMGLEAGAAGLGARFRGAGMDFSRLGGQVGGAFSRTFGGVASGVAGSWAMNRDMRLSTESPAEALRRQLGDLEAQRGRGLSDENYNRRRRQLRLGALSQIPGAEQTPNLAATEGRFITMGRRNEVKDELSALRRELKAEHAKDRTAIVSAIRESGGGNDSL